MKIADRAGISPFYVMEVMRAAEEREVAGDEVLHLEVGQPSTGAPRGVVDRAHRALDSGDALGYTGALGIAELRQAIADHYGQWYDVDVDPARVVVTTGASASCVLSFLAAFDHGDRVAVTSPGYPCYRNMLRAFGVEVVDVAVDRSTRFQPTAEVLAEHWPLDGVVVASPSNPTGTMLDATAMDDLVAWSTEHGVRLVSDEIYHGLTYGPRAVTAIGASTPGGPGPIGGPLVVNSFSKYFSMTGWRLGWLIVPPELADPVERLAQNIYISPPTIAQVAAVAAFDCHDELAANVDRYAANRAILLDGLPRAGLDELAPVDGAFYVWARVERDSQGLCAEWLRELGVAATPGIDFDPARGHDFVRFSFAGSTDDVSEAVARLITWSRRA